MRNFVQKAFSFSVIIIIAFSFIATPVFSSTLIGVAGIIPESPRAKMFATLIETHLDNILRSNFVASTGAFEPVNSTLLRNQLEKFSCTEESCIERFARKAHISIIVHGRIEERSRSLFLEISAFSIDVPYFGKAIHRYTAQIPTSGLSLSMREYSYIFEEHCARFISGMLRRYKKPLFVEKLHNRIHIDAPSHTHGIFTVYRSTTGSSDAASKTSSFLRYIPVGTITMRNGIPLSIPPFIREGDFILAGFSHAADDIQEFYDGRKRELVFTAPNSNDTFLMMLYTVPGSLTMPLFSPFLGYLAHQDYTGLALWSSNFAPYLYIEIKGIYERPQLFESVHRDISSSQLARYRFSLYMLLCGNMSLFVDAFASHNLYLASNYQGVQRYLGNTATAAYLSLVSGGGGHFYRGWRAWGYAYFHANNALLYYTIKEFSPSRNYNEITGRYEESSMNKRRAYSLLAAYCGFKIVEIIHAAILPDSIQNGSVEESTIFVHPIFSLYENRENLYGAALTMRF